MDTNKIKNSTIEELENDYWTESDGFTGLMKTLYETRKKKIGEYEPEDFRLLINQNIGLKHLIPLAIDVLTKNPFVEANYFEGDLLKSILCSDKNFWNLNISMKEKVVKLFDENKGVFNELDLTENIKNEIFDAYEAFRK